MRVGSFDSGHQAANPESPQHHGPRPTTIVLAPSNQNSQTHSSESGFRRMVKFATFEEADGLCTNIPHNGVKLATPGGRRRPKVCPIDLNRFSIDNNSGSQCLEQGGRAHLTQTTNQHLRIIVKLSSHAPSNHLEHLTTRTHRLPLKEIKGISQDRSVIETWGWASFVSGQQAANPESPQHSLATP